MSLGVGLIGCGWAAGEIVRAGASLPDLQIVAAYDPDAGRAATLAAKAGAGIEASVDVLLARGDVSVVYVGVPHHLLAGYVEQALLAGKHVLAEKPLALEPAEALRLGELARARGLKLGVFFELRRSGTVEAARRLVADGAIGVPRFVRIRTLIDKRLDYWGAPGALNWRARLLEAGGGVVMMNSIHQLDTLRYVTGLDYVSAMGTIATITAPGEVEDTASATLRLSGGAMASLVAAAHSPGARDAETIEIDGSEGQLVLPDPFGAAPLRLYSIRERAWRDIAVERPDSHALMLASFVQAIRNDGTEPATARDAAAALAVVRAIYRSAAEGREVAIG